MEENTGKDFVFFGVLISPLLLSIVFGLLSLHVQGKALFIFFIIMVIDTLSMNLVMLNVEEFFQSSAVVNLVYAFLYVFYSTLPMFKQPFRQSQYTYICIATAVVMFIFSLYFLTQFRLHPGNQKSKL